MTKTTYKGILLDLDNTVYEYAPAHEAGFEALTKALGSKINMEAVQVREAYKRQQTANQRQLAGQAASHSRLLYIQHILEDAGVFRCSLALVLEQVYWQAFLENMKPFQGMTEWLKGISLPICVVTDLTAEIQMKKIMKLDLDQCLTRVVTSEEAGVEKPHPFVFWAAAKKLGLSPDECVMVGDSLEKDIAGALGAGMDAVCFKGSKEALETFKEKSVRMGDQLQQKSVYYAGNVAELKAIVEQ